MWQWLSNLLGKKDTPVEDPRQDNDDEIRPNLEVPEPDEHDPDNPQAGV